MSSKITAVKVLVTLKCRDIIYPKDVIIKDKIPKELLREIEANSGYVVVVNSEDVPVEEVEEKIPVVKKRKLPVKRKL